MKAIFGMVLAVGLTVYFVSGFKIGEKNASINKTIGSEESSIPSNGLDPDTERGHLHAESGDPRNDPAVQDVLDINRARASLGLVASDDYEHSSSTRIHERRAESQRSLDDVIALSRQNAILLERIEQLSDR